MLSSHALRNNDVTRRGALERLKNGSAGMDKPCAATDCLTSKERDYLVVAAASLLCRSPTVLGRNIFKTFKLFKLFLNDFASLRPEIRLRVQAAERIFELYKKDLEGFESKFIIRLARCLRQIPIR